MRQPERVMRKEQPPDMDWQPLKTAPKDGTFVHLLSEDGEDIGYYYRGEWSTEYGYGEPSAWRPFMGGCAKYDAL